MALGATLIGEAAGRNYFNSFKGIKDDPEVASGIKEGFNWLLKSAEQGYVNAEERLGEEYYQGQFIGDRLNVGQDKEKGLIWRGKQRLTAMGTPKSSYGNEI